MIRFSFQAHIFPLAAFGLISYLCFLLVNCKPQCIDIADETRLLNNTHKSFIPYNSKDSLVTKDSTGTAFLYIADTSFGYFNTYNPNQKCNGTVKLEGRGWFFKTLTDTIKINLAILAEDSAQLGYYISWRNRTFTVKSDWLESVNAFDRTIGGVLFKRVYIVTIGRDSLYFNKSQGMVRIKVGAETRMVNP